MSAVSPAAGQLRHERQDVAGRRVAGRDEREVDEAVLHRVERAGRRRGMLGQHRELHAAAGGLLDLGGPALQHVGGQVVLGRRPTTTS